MPSPNDRPVVSIVLAVRNAAETVGVCLGSIEAQTIPHWEVIVVDDGSTDGTPARVAEFCQRDRRVRLLRQSPRGVSRARNEGIALAQYDWLLFLGPDDTLVPSALEALTDRLGEDPSADAVHAGWRRIMPNGVPLTPQFCDQENDLFEVFASRCVFPLHACVVRRSLVTGAGGFDPSLSLCEDWDLWQRIARMGARFRALRSPLSCHYLRDAPLSPRAPQDWLAAGLRVIRSGHAEDPRVRSPHHTQGLPPTHLPWATFTFLSWVAGESLAAGQEVHDLFRSVKGKACDELTPHVLAENLFAAATRTAPVRLSRADFLRDFVTRSFDFLRRLEDRSGTPALAIRASHHLEGMLHAFLSDVGALKQPLLIGRTLGACVEVTRPIADLAAPKGADRLCCTVTVEGDPLGTLYLPIGDPGPIPGWLLKDAIAGKFAWSILLRFFEHDMAEKIEMISSSEGTEARRGDVRLAARLPQKCSYQSVISHIGWTLFLQEVWGIPEWRESRFYERGQSPEPGPAVYQAPAHMGTELFVEVSSPLPPKVNAPGGKVPVVVCVGGIPLDRFTVEGEGGRVTAQQIRATVNATADMELCRIAVREGLIGTPFGGTRSLRERLAQAAARPGLTDTAEVGSTLRIGRAAGPIGTSISRRALLPVATAQAVRELAARSGQVASEPGQEVVRRLAYAPDLLGTISTRTQSTGSLVTAENKEVGGFEVIFSAGAASSHPATGRAQRRYEQALSLLPPGRIPKALELADEEEHLAARLLAERVDRLVVVDTSRTSAVWDATPFAVRPNVDILRLDLTTDAIPGRYDLITCGEALTNVADRTLLKAAADKIVNALEPGGHLILSRATGAADDPWQPGSMSGAPSAAKTIDQTFGASGQIHLIRELRTTQYCIQLFQKESLEEGDRAQPEVPAHVWPDARATTGSTTDWLPILLYHRVSPEAANPTRTEFCVTPQAFEAQLNCLAGAGFRSVGLEEWRLALTTRRPLEGRAVMFTFDGGYQDFAEYAWPLLKRYGFTAEVFLVAGLIGNTNERYVGRRTLAHLMGWNEIRRLQDEGVRFGSHTLYHPMLTSLSPVEVVEEAVRSRMLLERGLGAPVTSVAFPYGDTDPAIEHLFGACGYVYGLTATPRASGMGDSILSLPRITIRRSDGLEEFASKLGV